MSWLDEDPRWKPGIDRDDPMTLIEWLIVCGMTACGAMTVGGVIWIGLVFVGAI